MNICMTMKLNVHPYLLRLPLDVSTSPGTDFDQCVANAFLKHKSAHNDERIVRDGRLPLAANLSRPQCTQAMR